VADGVGCRKGNKRSVANGTFDRYGCDWNAQPVGEGLEPAEWDRWQSDVVFEDAAALGWPDSDVGHTVG